MMEPESRRNPKENIDRKKIEGKCIYLNDLGEGVFKDGKQFASCPNFLRGEKAIIEKVSTFSRTRYRVYKRLNEARERVNPKCPIYDKCGGCQLLHMNYDNQIRFKYDYVVSAFKEYNLNAKIDEVIKANITERYRNKMQVAYSSYNGKKLVGAAVPPSINWILSGNDTSSNFDLICSKISLSNSSSTSDAILTCGVRISVDSFTIGSFPLINVRDESTISAIFSAIFMSS